MELVVSLKTETDNFLANNNFASARELPVYLYSSLSFAKALPSLEINVIE